MNPAAGIQTLPRLSLRLRSSNDRRERTLQRWTVGGGEDHTLLNRSDQKQGKGQGTQLLSTPTPKFAPRSRPQVSS
jgi:hypothetical protein